MTASAARKQGEIKGMRAPELIELEEATWDLKEIQEEKKKLKDREDEAKENVVAKLKKCDLVAHGFSRGGEMLTVSVEDKEVVKLTVGKPKAKKNAAFPHK